jgi:hypothetical protein
MALVLHEELLDGSIIHLDFTRSAWELSLHDPNVTRRWGHRPNECYDIVARHWAQLRKNGWRCTPAQHAWADKDDPGWVGSRELVQTPKVGPPTEEPIVWPPQVELKPWMLCLLTTLCLDDARSILAPPRKEIPTENRRPVANKKGQYSLF